MDNKDLTFQQKVLIWGRTFLRGATPLLIYIMMPAATLSFGYVAFNMDMSAKEFFSYGGNFYTAIGMMLALYVLHKRSQRRGHKFFEDATLYLEKAEWKKSICFFVFGMAAALTLSSVLTLLPRWGIVNDYSESSQTMFKGLDMLFTLITTMITAPLAEEIVFRGYMLNTFLEQFDVKKSILSVSAIFAICHGDPLWILYAMGMGILLCWLSIREDNIYYGILLHMGFNTPSGLIWIMRSYPEVYDLFFTSKLLIFGYGLACALLCIRLAKKYLS